jgi:serine/threonine protein kinase
MNYYPLGNIVNASMHEDEHVAAWGQILDGLSHLHAKGVVHRDLKPENILIERDPLFKVVIADFGLAKIANDDALLLTFCGTLKYAAPEVFPGMSRGHGPLVDVWSLGVMVYEWLYGVVNLPDIPTRKGETDEVFWFAWLDLWVNVLLRKLEDEHDDNTIRILRRMIEMRVPSRWPANRCLTQGFNSGLFERRRADGLVSHVGERPPPQVTTSPDDNLTRRQPHGQVTYVGERQDSELSVGAQQDAGARTPTAAPSLSSSLIPERSSVTIIEGDL